MFTTAPTALTAALTMVPTTPATGHGTGWLEQASTCTEGEEICQHVLDWTGSQTAADAADLAIGKPMAILGLVILALVIRWVLFKLVDRIVKKAEAGVLPDRLSDRFASANATRRVQRAK